MIDAEKRKFDVNMSELIICETRDVTVLDVVPRPSKDSRTLELFRRSASKKEDKYRTRHLIRHNHTYSMSIYSLVSTRVTQEDATTNASNTYRQRQKADV